MRRLIINMRNYILSDALTEALRAHSDYEVYKADSAKQALELCNIALPNALLLEVSDAPGWRPEEMQPIREAALKNVSDCKTVLFLDEKGSRDLVENVKQIKKDGFIDQFVFSSVSAAYLVAMMDAL